MARWAGGGQARGEGTGGEEAIVMVRWAGGGQVGWLEARPGGKAWAEKKQQ